MSNLRPIKAMVFRIEAPLTLRLTGQESKMFGVMVKRDLVTKEQAMFVLYGSRPDGDQAEIRIVDVFVCKMRKKLKPYGMQIETVWGRGYRMPAESKAIAAQLLAESRAA